MTERPSATLLEISSSDLSNKVTLPFLPTCNPRNSFICFFLSVCSRINPLSTRVAIWLNEILTETSALTLDDTFPFFFKPFDDSEIKLNVKSLHLPSFKQTALYQVCKFDPASFNSAKASPPEGEFLFTSSAAFAISNF